MPTSLRARQSAYVANVPCRLTATESVGGKCFTFVADKLSAVMCLARRQSRDNLARDRPILETNERVALVMGIMIINFPAAAKW